MSDPATDETTMTADTTTANTTTEVKAETPKRVKRAAVKAPIDTLDEFAGDPPATLSRAVQVNF